MRVTIRKAQEIGPKLLEIWRKLQNTHSHLSSPFFCPEFTLAVSAARDDVRIAVIEIEGSIKGFFPFQVDSRGFGKPVGWGIADYQGIICAPAFQCDAEELLQACGLIAWDFDHLDIRQGTFARFRQQVASSPLIDLRRGFQAYMEERCAVGTNLFRELKKKSSRLERDFGKLSFIANTGDHALFERLLSWKSAQFARMRVRDVVAVPWIRNTLAIIRTADEPNFAGMTSILQAGSIPVAAHFGMRSSTIWHRWFTAYAPEFSRYSPGALLLYKMAETAPNLGISLIDLGGGKARYKDRFKNAENLIAEGSVECGAFLKASRGLGRGLRAAVQYARLEKSIQQLIYSMGETPLRRYYEFFATGPRRFE